MLCPECGQEVDRLVHGACPSCAAGRRVVLDAPDVVDPVVCPHCGNVQRGAHWEAAPSDRDLLVRSVLDHAIQIDPDIADVELTRDVRWEDVRNASVTMRVAGTLHGVPVAAEGTTRVRIKSESCQECSRRYGGYFEAILQVRGHDPRTLEKHADKVLRRIEGDLARFQAERRTGAYVNRAEPVRGGYDFYVGSLEVARLVAHDVVSHTGADYAESKTLTGRKEGQDVYRFTLLVRLPAFGPGDFIEYDGRLCKVLRQDRKLLTLWDFERNTKLHRAAKRAKTLKVVGRAEDEKDAVLVSHTGRNVQVLDPDTLRTLDMEASWDVGEVQTVRVFRYGDDLVLVPAEAVLAEP